ncbi:MAG TPA: magnesium transporter CorA family protein [Microvirga sp.]|jgi:magnesium transporter|nr:magnesium transporter CorA family protein [Microvirga sp.]
MIIIHRPTAPCAAQNQALDRHLWQPGEGIPPDAVWIDLIEPTREEDRLVEAYLGIEIPTRDEMADIEPSEILYNEPNARYMTARILCSTESETPKLADISFILTGKALVTVRYDEPRSFTMFMNRAVKPGGCGHQPEAVLDGLVETIIDRAADILAGVGRRIDVLSREIFDNERKGARRTAGFRAAIKSLGRKGDILSNMRESMVSFERMMLFLSAPPAHLTRGHDPAEWRRKIDDIKSIEEHAAFLSGKVQFLLDATLGLVSIEQNDVFKFLAILSGVLLPPTLVGAIYGMNFEGMPELQWAYGYPTALAIMVASALGPYFFMRWKRWL